MTCIDEQSPDIALGVNASVEAKGASEDLFDSTGAGDQGMVFGFACTQTDELMPAPIYYSHKLTQRLAQVRKDRTLPFVWPDGKAQVSIEYADDRSVRSIPSVVVSTQHSGDVSIETVREGVMRKEYAAQPGAGEVKAIDWKKMVTDADLAVKIIDRQIEERKIDIKGAGIIVAGGYGMGSKENFRLVHELADVLGGEVGASRAAVDAGFTEHARQVGQTGVTVRPKLYIACGISGQIQHKIGRASCRERV